jgi:hypothetical protein
LNFPLFIPMNWFFRICSQGHLHAGKCQEPGRTRSPLRHENHAPPAIQALRRDWLWLLPLTLTTPLISALGLLMGNGGSLLAGGGFLGKQDSFTLLVPIPGTLITWAGLLIALLRPRARTRTGAVLTVAGGLTVGLPLLAVGAPPLVLLFWATLLLALPALRPSTRTA